jgi:hypothetical protein
MTVNGMHTVIAFRTLCDYAASQKNYKPPEKCPPLPLLSDETITQEQRDEIWSWGVAQMLVLMWWGCTSCIQLTSPGISRGAFELVEFPARA